jgi:UTP--glucose-1-phosphate uridylyltransferase
VVENPSPEEAPRDLAVAARYVLSPRIFEALDRTSPGKGGEIQLTDAIRLLIREGGKVYGMKLRSGERRFDIGNYDAYFRAFIEFALADEKYGPALRDFLRKLLK